jgi:hypothetical protein
MKKVYTKPEIMFEDFTLSACIAGCANEAVFDGSNCKAYQLRSGEVVFMETHTGCITVEADGDYNGYCYHVPTVSLNLFGS